MRETHTSSLTTHARRKFSAALAEASADKERIPPLADEIHKRAGRTRYGAQCPRRRAFSTRRLSPPLPYCLTRTQKTLRSTCGAASSSTARAVLVKPEFVPPKWITSVQLRRTPYAPQIGDVVVYFHQWQRLYVNAVQSNNLFTIHQNALPWLKYPHLPVSAS